MNSFKPPASQPGAGSNSSLGAGHQPGIPCRCEWDRGSCGGILLDDLSPAGIMRHLKDYHYRPWDGKQRVACVWGTNGCRSDPIVLENIGKHVASVHLKSTQSVCRGCGKVFARPDTLSRHIAEACPNGA
ncbi:hypothetical protein B0H21DRAFT_712078 [Amylocystis lapponica]|nr:hypothetical protein B0H21DRAFT_712078 [Amylocystis lapponica]